MESGAANDLDWPGRRIGLPREGRGSVARPGRRLAALAIDWALAVVISVAFFSYDATATLAIFAIMQIILLASASASIGHITLGLRVVLSDGGLIGLWRPIVRTALLCLVIPAVIWDRDQRGMHDRLIGAVLVRSRV